MDKNTFLRKIYTFIKSIFLNGLFAIFPLAATIFVINFIYNLTSKWLAPLKKIEPNILKNIPGAEFILFIVFIMTIGILLKFLIIIPIIHWAEHLIKKIPIINTIYSSSKTLINFFNVPDSNGIQRKVILVRYPNKEYFNIAFLVGTANKFEELLPDQFKKGIEYVKVFMPTTPNPTTGYFFILPRSEIVETEISFENAIKMIGSCGLISTEHI